MSKEIGITLSLLRKEKLKTLRALSALTGLSISYLSAIEQGRKTPDLNVLTKISNALDAPLYILVFKADKEAGLPFDERKTVREYKSLFNKLTT